MREILVNVTPRETRAALVENGVTQELYIERASRRGLVGNLYKGRVSRVLPGMQAAFIDIGLERTAFLHAGDCLGKRAELALSLDVIYHLVEDGVFSQHMRTLFAAADRFVIIYASDSDANDEHEGRHVRHRKFSRWVAENQPSWELLEHVPNRYPYRGDYRKGSFADFFIYARVAGR